MVYSGTLVDSIVFRNNLNDPNATEEEKERTRQLIREELAKHEVEGPRLKIKNRDEFKCFVPSPIEYGGSTRRVRSIRFTMKSPDEEYKKLKKENRQIDITSPEIYVNGKKPTDGIFSPLFGADSTQDTPIYTCDCHNLIGGANRGHKCPKCGTECRSIEADLRITGHIDIAPYHILTFHGWNAFAKIFKEKKLNEIITTNRKIDRSGKVIRTDLPTIMDLYDDYDEVYASQIGLPKNIVFMTKIPVYSSRLRPLLQEHMTMSILDVNKRYLSMVTLMGNLKSSRYMPNVKREVEVQRTLNQLQQDFNEVIKIIEEQINGKEGVFRHALASGRLDGSSRLVISLGTDLMAHEVDVPIQTFIMQYEEELCNRLAVTEDITIAKAIELVEANMVRPTQKFINLVNSVLRKSSGFATLVNRNPTISETGIILMYIRRVHEDMTDMTLHLPVDVLTGLAADFDGDQVTEVSIRNPKYVRYFQPMCPTYAFVDRADARYSRAMAFAKDYAALISAGWDLDTVYDNYLTDPNEANTEAFKALGIDDDDADVAQAQRERVFAALFDPKVKGKFKERYDNPFGMWHVTGSNAAKR